MTKKISETLTAARAILADPAKWTQGTHARDAEGRVVEINDKDATCYCLDGAIALAAGVEVDCGCWLDNEHYDATSRLLRETMGHINGTSSYIEVNDGEANLAGMSSHQAVLFVLDKGIDIAKSREELGIVRAAP